MPLVGQQSIVCFEIRISRSIPDSLLQFQHDNQTKSSETQTTIPKQRIPKQKIPRQNFNKLTPPDPGKYQTQEIETRKQTPHCMLKGDQMLISRHHYHKQEKGREAKTQRGFSVLSFPVVIRHSGAEVNLILIITVVRNPFRRISYCSKGQ